MCLGMELRIAGKMGGVQSTRLVLGSIPTEHSIYTLPFRFIWFHRFHVCESKSNGHTTYLIQL